MHQSRLPGLTRISRNLPRTTPCFLLATFLGLVLWSARLLILSAQHLSFQAGDRRPAPISGTIRFVEVAEQAGVTAPNVWGGVDRKKFILETKGNGVGFLDYDRDGWPDIYLSNGTRMEGFKKGLEPTNHLYHNNGDGTFTDVT